MLCSVKALGNWLLQVCVHETENFSVSNSKDKVLYLKGWFLKFPVWAIVGDSGGKKNECLYFKIKKK